MRPSPDQFSAPKRPWGFLVAAIFGIGGGLVLLTFPGDKAGDVTLVVAGVVALARYLLVAHHLNQAATEDRLEES